MYAGGPGGRLDLNVQLLERIGGRANLRPVIVRFYAKMSAHPVLGQFFEGIDLERQAQRLEAFLVAGAPGEPPFDGPYPYRAHAHMLITQDMLKQRVALLRDAIEEEGHPAEIVQLWLKTDALWHAAVRKRSVSDCNPKLSGKPLKVVEP